MPLARIDLVKGKSSEYRRAIADGVYRALVEAVGAPENDQFAVVSEHDSNDLVYDPTYLSIDRTDEVVFIQITLNEGRTVEKKKALYAKICELLAQKPGVRPEDVMINLIEVSKANWSYGKGRPNTFPESRLLLARRALLRTGGPRRPGRGWLRVGSTSVFLHLYGVPRVGWR